MKSNYKLFAMFMACGLLVSCSGNEPGGDTVLEIDGERLTSVGGWDLSYDARGRVTECAGKYNTLTVDYKSNRIYIEDDDERIMTNVRFNARGYFSEVWQDWNYIDDGYRVKGSGKASFSYDGEGHLSRVMLSSNETSTNNGRTYMETEKTEISLKWSDGNLLAITEKGNSSSAEDGDESWTETNTYGYDHDKNTYRQMTWSIADAFVPDDWHPFAMAGMMGVGTMNLPASVIEYEDAGEISASDISYVFTSAGAIRKERIGSYNINYSYNGIESSFRDAPSASKEEAPGMLFFKRSRR